MDPLAIVLIISAALLITLYLSKSSRSHSRDEYDEFDSHYERNPSEYEPEEEQGNDSRTHRNNSRGNKKGHKGGSGGRRNRKGHKGGSGGRRNRKGRSSRERGRKKSRGGYYGGSRHPGNRHGSSRDDRHGSEDRKDNFTSTKDDYQDRSRKKTEKEYKRARSNLSSLLSQYNDAIHGLGYDKYGMSNKLSQNTYEIQNLRDSISNIKDWSYRINPEDEYEVNQFANEVENVQYQWRYIENQPFHG